MFFSLSIKGGLVEMNFDYVKFITDPFVLIFLSVISGLMIGKIEIKRVKLGNSGGLFTGLVIGWYVYKTYALPYEKLEDIPAYVKNIFENGMVPKELFLFTLICFIASVGLLASKDIGKVIKKYGFKFVLLGLSITSTGALICFIMAYFNKGSNIYAISGTYVGALTCSPGLAAVLESVSSLGKEAEAMIGFGYAVGYIPGVTIITLSMQILPIIFKIDIEKEKQLFKHEMRDEEEKINLDAIDFDVLSFLFVCIVGFFLGQIKIYMGEAIKYVSFGSAGGVLIAGLILGHIGKIGFMNFKMNPKILGIIRELSLSIFLAIVGLRYGYSTITTIAGEGGQLVLLATACSALSILMGFIIGRNVFKINGIMLLGALCGGMTSTPGLGAAINSVDSDDVVAGYGATYPFALLGKIIFGILLYRLPI
jgi:putative transport protein